jgi:hypothetical protein
MVPAKTLLLAETGLIDGIQFSHREKVKENFPSYMPIYFLETA